MKRKYTKRKRKKKIKKVGSFYDLLIPGKRFDKKSRRKARRGGSRGGSHGVKLPPDAMRRAKKAEEIAISRQRGKTHSKASESSSDEDEDSGSSGSSGSSSPPLRKKTISKPTSIIIGKAKQSTAKERREIAAKFLNGN